MIPPSELNFDVIVRELLKDMAHAVNGWRSGNPADETALMNRITERLRRDRKNCDVGVEHPVTMVGEFYALHRRGESQDDKFGADLAVTIQIPQIDLLKTVFFQFKISSHYRVTLLAEQLRQPARFHGVLPRSFVLAVDRERYGYRVRPTSDCLMHFEEEQQLARFEISKWECLTQWLLEWFSCKHGPPTTPDDPHPVEKMLASYRTPPCRDIFREAWLENLPRDMSPARGWLHYVFHRGSPSTSLRKR